MGDYIKSWDVLSTATFIQNIVSQEAPILDIGAYASEILCVLRRLNYSTLTGIDLNPKINLMPYADTIRYQVADFTHTPFGDQSFEVITAISVIEHGFRSESLLREVSRLLLPGGYFLASFDYWPEKIDTTGISIFGMEWKIFSKAEVLTFINEGQAFGLAPCGRVNLDARDGTINWNGRRYTFAWMALQKNAGGNRRHK